MAKNISDQARTNPAAAAAADTARKGPQAAKAASMAASAGLGRPGGPIDAGMQSQGISDGGGRGKRTAIIVALLVALAALVVWLCLWLFACGGPGMFDPNARDGQAPYKSAEEMQAELDRVVDEGMFNISIASAIQFQDGTSPGTAYIENVPGNHYLMRVSITDDATGEMLYESGVLKPNQFIEEIVLTRDLDAGTYPATATFTAIDETTHEEAGQAAAKINITVLE